MFLNNKCIGPQLINMYNESDFTNAMMLKTMHPKLHLVYNFESGQSHCELYCLCTDVNW